MSLANDKFNTKGFPGVPVEPGSYIMDVRYVLR